MIPTLEALINTHTSHSKLPNRRLALLKLPRIATSRGFNAARSKESDQTSVIVRNVNISNQFLAVVEVTP